MKQFPNPQALAIAGLLAIAPSAGAVAQDAGTSFFVTSVGPGDGANLGGLEGADAHCQTLAEAAGVTGKTWRAYLSTSGDGAVNARDRIGSGPWVNAKGVEIAASVEELHTEPNKINKDTRPRREGQYGQRARRRPEPARHADGNRTGRHGLRWRRGPDLQQLDVERRRLGHGWPPRPDRQPAEHQLLELFAPLAEAAARKLWLEPAEPDCSTASRNKSEAKLRQRPRTSGAGLWDGRFGWAFLRGSCLGPERHRSDRRSTRRRPARSRTPCCSVQRHPA